ncbi:LemA family protein [Vampirovibrio sp.]|uniref:LemA family protein n=1 Tax=Vampirovibrio sp. TaxID=2717857 RepID=UPI0035930AD4
MSLFKRNRNNGLGSTAVILLALVGVIIVAGLWFTGSYNGLVNQDAELELRASNVESQLKRRADLVPNLVATVKGYAKHEQEVYNNIASARSRLLNADVNTNPQEAAAANGAFNASLGRLLAIAENYPQLKADQNFIRLQDELTGTENRINVARLAYNDAVKTYNVSVRSFPGNIVAGISGFERKVPFEATASEKALPKVAF